MTRLRVMLRGGQEYEVECAEGDPLVASLADALSGQGGGAVQFEVEHDGLRRGIALPAAAILAVETDPPLRLPRVARAGHVEQPVYLRIPGFLTPEENRTVVEFAAGKEPAFQASRVDGDEKDYRLSRVLFDVAGLGVDFAGRVREILPDVAAHFGMGLPEGYRFEMQMTTHGDGGYFKIHADNASPSTAARYLTYVYYFHREPRAYSGGLLRLHERVSVGGGGWLPLARCADIPPENNQIIFFPSGQMHEVMPTHCRSGAFADGRFTINGWISPPAMG